MRNFTIFWSGQMASAIGTAMTQFALTIWIWQITQESTAIALLSFLFQVPQILITLLAGVIIDRVNRKRLMIVSDAIVALCTLLIGLLYATHTLQVWHLYALAVAYGCFEQLQTLAYSASISLMVPKQHYARASSISSLVTYGSAILAPALVGLLYPTIGVLGIMAIDVFTFAIGIGSVWIIPIPQPPKTEGSIDRASLGQELFFGLKYIRARPSLWALTILFCAFLLTYHMGETLYQPMILARTQGNTQILGMVVTAAGLGGVVGSIVLSLWGGFQRRIHGVLIGFIGAGLGRICLGVGQLYPVWLGAQFFSAFNLPGAFGSSYAIWYAKVEPEVQGRVLASAHMLGLIVGAIATLMAGPLADQVFEPLMTSGNGFAQIFTPLVGSGLGSGMAALFLITAIGMVALGIAGYCFPSIRNGEDLLPDHDHNHDDEFPPVSI
ncbi:MFS transporter [Alkalinema pantanalense CENA528]|uniref:MFS transporter n=1 Tax=Alkalinema pantanalense TaxID=1620705 RepID=UPI003D6F77C6